MVEVRFSDRKSRRVAVVEFINMMRQRVADEGFTDTVSQ